MITIAVMQPYFFPYAGYFRLFTAADVFIILDSVQLPRPGWVHRNRFETATGESAWLTLPLQNASHTAAINERRLRPDASTALKSLLRRFPLLNEAWQTGHPLLRNIVEISDYDLTTYLEGLLAQATAVLGIPKPMVRASSLAIDPGLRGQERVLSIVRTVGGTRYVNAPGGRQLYDRDAFRSQGVDLQFLSPYRGSARSILSRLLSEPVAALRKDIAQETVLLD